MAGALKEAVDRLEASFGGRPNRPVARIVCEDEGTVSFTIMKDDGGTSRISVCYADVSSYPNSTVWFAADNNEPMEAFQSLSENQFQDHAPLERVVTELLNVYGMHVELPNAPLSCKQPVLQAGSDDDVMGVEDESEDDDEYQGMEQDSADGDEDEAADEDEDDEEEREMMISCGTRQGRWERWEERCKAMEATTSKGAGLSFEQASAKKQQIFEPREAFMMLSKELLHILRQQSFDMFVDSVGDDVYSWSVELGSFDPKSNLYKDMQEIQRRHQYSFVKLVLKFKRSLHPFYPPSVEVVRPHLKGCIAAAVASHPMLKLSNWDPWQPIEDLIRNLKLFLQAVAEVDIDHPMNDISRFPVSSYRPVDVQLARLNTLSGLDMASVGEPRIQELQMSCSHDQARLEALASESNKKRTRETQPKDPKTVWARGTGYGSGDRSNQDPVWDARASEAAQRARDEELRALLESLASHISYDLELRDAMQLDGLSCSSSDTGCPPPEPKCSAQLGTLVEDSQHQVVAPDATECLSALASSCLMAFLVQELKAASFTDMCSRVAFYLGLLRICKIMVLHEEAAKLLWQSPMPDGSSVANMVLAIVDSAKHYTRVTKAIYEKEVEEQRQTTATLAACQVASASVPVKSSIPTPQQETLQEMQGGLQLAALVQEVAGLLLERQATGCDQDEEGCSGSRPSISSDREYCELLQPMQVEYMPDLKAVNHSYAHFASVESVQPKARMSRLAKEIAGLQQLLPLNECSSVFVRVDEENVTLWRTLITGPEDTPYSCGCFIFDFYFPPNYPSVPPQVTLKTTGGGRVRFNPNLYTNGKVCLSLLGTWEGAKGEGWNPTASSALQVLLSIQSLILVPQPYFNEPGFERQYNSEEGKKQSRSYNQDITEATLRYAMIDLLQHPPKELEGVIKGHFRLRRQAILDTTEAWERAASEWNQSHASNLTKLRQQLSTLLSQL